MVRVVTAGRIPMHHPSPGRGAACGFKGSSVSHCAAVQAERSAGGRAEPARGEPFAVASVEPCGAAAPPELLLAVQVSFHAQHLP